MADYTPEELRDLVRQEVENAAIRDLVAKAAPPKGRDWDKILRHPAMLAIIGFLLTTVFAQLLQLTLSAYDAAKLARETERAKIRTESADAIALLDELVLLANNRATELSLIRFALQDGDAAVIQTRFDRYYELYREWVTTYQAQARKIMVHMGVRGASAEVRTDPFYKAVESKLGWESFVLAHDCVRRLRVVGMVTEFERGYEDWWTTGAPWDSRPRKFNCPRSANSPLSTRPVSFIINRYQTARSCATELFFYGRDRIQAYESQRLARLDRWFWQRLPEPKAPEVLEDDLPGQCKLI